MKVLISPLGLSPGVVTAAYYLLEPTYGRMDRIVTVTTDHALASLCEGEIQRELENIEDESGHFVEYDALRVPSRGGEPVTEIRSLVEVRQFTRQMQELLREHIEAGHEVFLNLTGGHKSMIAAAATAAQFFKPRLTFHVLVDEEIEREGRITNLLKKPAAERRGFMKPARASLVRLDIQEAVSRRDVQEMEREFGAKLLKAENYKKQLWGRLFEVELGYYLESELGYEDVRTGYEPNWIPGDVDVFARRGQGDNQEIVLIEAKLSHVTIKAVNQIIARREALLNHLENSDQMMADDRIHVWVVTNSEGEIDWDAQEKAERENVVIWRAELSSNWETRADFKVEKMHRLDG